MNINIFSKIIKDKHFPNYDKLKYKYGEDFGEFLKVLDELYYTPLPLNDFNGNNIVYIDNFTPLSQNAVKLLLKPQYQNYSVKSAENEIIATYAIENIDFSRDSVRRILKGMAPADEEESRIEGIKRGLDFISDTSNKITEENFYRLYMTAIGDFLENENRLKDGELYRHDTVYVVSDRVEHAGIEHGKLGAYMKKLFDFINRKDDINDLVKAAVIHFYIAFLHPYFDGNGRMARLVHLWFLVQNGYRSALFIDFSGKIEKNRKAYYDAFTLIEENKKFSGKIDVTPFVLFFTKYVYNEINKYSADTDVINLYEEAQRDGKITDKESKLWKFVLSFYSNDEFSTKQLEKDFGNAAYATIRGFVLKFEKLGLLTSVKYSSRVKYKINQ